MSDIKMNVMDRLSRWRSEGDLRLRYEILNSAVLTVVFVLERLVRGRRVKKWSGSGCGLPRRMITCMSSRHKVPP